MPDQRNPVEELKWCHGCGDYVTQLGETGLCRLCEEVDARMDAHVGAAMEDYAERAIGVALDYLAADDVLDVIARLIEDRGDDPEQIPRLRERYTRSHAFVDERARAARARVAELKRQGELETDADTEGTPPVDAAE